MSTHDNKALLQRIYADLAEGSSRSFVEAMADNFRWVIAGSSRWPPSFDATPGVMPPLCGARRATIADRVRTSATRFIADGDQVVVEARGNNVTRAGVPYRNSYCMIYTVRDGKLVEMVEYMDTDLALKVLGDPAELIA
jgi:ketosteroid isomerase-like protein